MRAATRRHAAAAALTESVRPPRMPDLPLVTIVAAALAVTLAYTVFGLTGFGPRSSASRCSRTSFRSASRCR